MILEDTGSWIKSGMTGDGVFLLPDSLLRLKIRVLNSELNQGELMISSTRQPG